MLRLKAYYGQDPDGSGTGFYWPESPAKRSEVLTVKRGSPADFESVYQGRPGSRSGSIFIERDFSYYVPPEGLMDGISSPSVMDYCKRGHGVFSSWDTAFSDTNQSAYTVGITALFIPCSQYHRGEDAKVFGPCESHFDVAILDVFREKISWGDLVDAFKLQRLKWRPELSVVEKRMSGISLIQSMQSAGLPIHAAIPVESKRARAVNGVGAGSAQGWFRQHRVLFPAPFKNGTVVPWLSPLKTELKDFTGDESGFSDQVDAIVHLIRYAIIEGSTSALLPSDWTPERGTEHDVESAISAMNNPFATNVDRGAFFTMLGDLPSLANDPFAESCGRCDSFNHNHCRVHHAPRVALDSCTLFTPREP